MCQQLVHPALGIGKRFTDGFGAHHRSFQLFTNQALDRRLPLHKIGQLLTVRRHCGNITAMWLGCKRRRFEHCPECREMAGPHPIAVILGDKRQEARNRLLFGGRAGAGWHNPGVAIDKCRVLPPQPGKGQHCIATKLRIFHARRLVIRADHPGAGGENAPLTVKETGRSRRKILRACGQFFRVERAVQFDDLARLRGVEPDVAVVGEYHRVLRHQISVEIGDKIIRRTDLCLDKIWLPCGGLEAPRMVEQFGRRRWQHRFAIFHQPGLCHKLGIDMPKPAYRIPGQRIIVPVLDRPTLSGERQSVCIYAGFRQCVIHRRKQTAGLIVRYHRLVHRDEIRWIASGNLGRKLRITRPGDNVYLDVDVRVLCNKAIENGCQNAAFGFGLGDINAVAVNRTTFAKKALDDQSGFVFAAAATAKHHRGQNDQYQIHAGHRVAAPAIAPTICFWKMM